MKYIILGIVALGILGGGLYYYKTTKDKTTQQNVGAIQENDSNNPVVKKTLEDLLSGKRQAECTFSHEKNQTIITGKVYIDNKRLRADFTTSDPEFGNIDGSMIRDNKYIYIWDGPMGEAGTKVKIEEAAEDVVNNFIDSDEEIDFSCSFWFVKDRVFVPPANVAFTDISAPLEEVLVDDLEKLQADCSLCSALLNDEAKADCREEFKCE